MDRPLRTLLIDNYDSFTFNLFQLIAEVNGVEPWVVRNDQCRWAELAELEVDNIVISPGPGRPDRAADFGVCGEVILRAELPLLGVCLGHQGIAAAFGGAVVRAPEPMHGRLSAIRHDGGRLFAAIPQGAQVVRYHSLCVDPALPACLRATAWTDAGLIMGLEHRERPCWGVQFHPESISTEHGARLLANFAALTRSHAARRPRGSGSGRRGAPSASALPEAYPQAKEPAALELRRRTIPFDPRDAERAFQALFGASEAAFWLDSSLAGPGLARFSFLGDDGGPLGGQVRYDQRRGEVEARSGGAVLRRRCDLFDFIEEDLSKRSCVSGGLPFDLIGGLVGYLGYELKAGLGGGERHASPLADAAFIRAGRLVAIDHQEGLAHLVALCPRGGDDGGWVDASAGRLADLPRSSDPAPSGAPLELRFALPRATYLDAIARCQALIAEGESYELCLTNQISAGPVADPFALYLALRRLNPAPYAAFLRFGEVAVLSSSPERFLRIDAGGAVESRPIKGTRPRADDPARDEALRRDLATCEKDRSENLMIVDLLRNDLGQVCEVGSVHVPALMEVETYESVHQLVSTIRGQLRPGISAAACARAAFPGGSMTGAPKRRTMRLLDALEAGPRGIYSGALGYFSVNGAADLSIVIRTLVATPDACTLGVGGAIVALSDADEEFEETLVKARAPIDALIAAARGEPDRELRERLVDALRRDGRARASVSDDA